MEKFNEFIMSRSKILPIENKTIMNTELDAFLRGNSGSDFTNYIDFNIGDVTANGQILPNATLVAIRQLCGTQISKNWGASKLWTDGYEKWQKWVTDFNNGGNINLKMVQTAGIVMYLYNFQNTPILYHIWLN